MEERFNVLGKLIIPKIHFTLKYITSEIEEKEREENFRLKRFKQLKIKRRDEEVHICCCCFSTFAAGEIMDGDMCTLCKKNICVKGKIEGKVIHAHCIKDGQLRLETACHLDSQRIHVPHAEDNTKHLNSNETLQIKNKEMLVDLEKGQMGNEKNKTPPLDENVRDEQIPQFCDILHDEDYVAKKLSFICCETQEIHMYSYILGVLNSVYEDILPEKSPLHLRKQLSMPANLRYPYEGIDILPRLLHMPKDIIPAYIETCTKGARTETIKMPSNLGSYTIPCVECKSLLNANEYKTSCQIKNCEKCRSLIRMPSDVPILSCPNCSKKSYLTMPLNIPINISPCQSVHKNCNNLSPFMSFISNTSLDSTYLPYEVPKEILVCHSWTPNLKKLLRIPKRLSPASGQRESTSKLPNICCSCQPNVYSFYSENEALHMYIHQLCQPQRNGDFIRMPLNLTPGNQQKDRDNIMPTYKENSVLQSQTSSGHIKMPSDLNLASCEKCASQSEGHTRYIKMPLDLGLIVTPCIEYDSQFQVRTRPIKTPSDLDLDAAPCVECDFQSQARAKPMKMPSNLDLDAAPCVECDFQSQARAKPMKMPSDLDLDAAPCVKCASKSQLHIEHIKMPSNLDLHSTPCIECRAHLNKKIDKTTCEMKNCEKCRSAIHMPLDVPILSCPNCTSKLFLTMPLDRPIFNSPCQSVKNVSPFTSFLSKTTPYSSYMPYALPQETLVCHSWTPKLKKLLHMPRNLSSSSTQSEPTYMSRCSCQPNMNSVNPQNELLQTYIHRLCQPQHNENCIRMPLNLVIENQPSTPRGTVYITKEKSTCSPCVITLSDEEKLYHDCKIDVDHSCDSTCSLCLKNSDYEKIVKVETKKKRRPDGKFREEKVVTEKYVVKTLIKPPDICSCSRSDEFEDALLGVWSCDHHKKEENNNKRNTCKDKTDKTDDDTVDRTEANKIIKTDGGTTYKTDEFPTGSKLETEFHPCLNCISNKGVGKKDVRNEMSTIICRCNQETSNEAQMKCKCYNLATSENGEFEKICTLKRLPDLVCCKNDGCFTQNLLKILTPCQIMREHVASECSASNPCHSIVIKSADNETIVCTRSNSKECSRSCLEPWTPRKEMEISQPSSEFSKLKNFSSGETYTCPILPLDKKLLDHASSSAKASAELKQESTMTKIVQTYLNKNNHKSTSCTDLEIIREVLKRSEDVTKPYISPYLCNKEKLCLTENCPFHSHSTGESTSIQERNNLDIKIKNLFPKKLESSLPVTPKNTEMNLDEANVSQKDEFEDEYLKIKEEIDKVIKLTTKKDSQAYYKTVGKVESSKSCCLIPSRLGMPITPTPIISIPKSPLASNVYPSKYNNNDLKTKDTGTQMKPPICDKEVNPCDPCSKTSPLSCHGGKSKNAPINEHHNHIQGKDCTISNKKSASLSSHSGHNETESKVNKNNYSSHHHHQKHHHDHHSDNNKAKEKYEIKIKVNDFKKPLRENDDFYIEGELEDGENVVIMPYNKSNLSKYTRPDDTPETICKNCLAILRGEKPLHASKCNKCHQPPKKCKYCDLLADYSVSGDPSVNVSSVGSSHHFCQTDTISAKSSFISSVNMPGEELCSKFSTSPSQSNKTRFSSCSNTPSRAALKTCKQASKIRGYASDCTIQKPLKSICTPPPRPCKSVCIVVPKTSDACTSTKVVNRYDVRSICDEPRSRRRSRSIPKVSNARCTLRPLQNPMKSDSALHNTNRRTRPIRTRSFYESDCKFFKPPCCGCPF